MFPECQCIDAINISQRQLDYCAEKLPQSLRGKVNLYLCNAQDVHQLPEPSVPYDFVFVRGVFFHLVPSVFEAAVAGVARRMHPGGIMLLSDPLYKDVGENSQDEAVACPSPQDKTIGHDDHKSPEYYTSVLEKNGFLIKDMRVLPSNAEFIPWFAIVRLNIEANFPDFPNRAPKAVRELHGFAGRFAEKLAREEVSMYSVVAQFAGNPK